MVNLRQLNAIGRRYQAAAKARFKVNELAASAQHAAKLAIFAAQRGEPAEAERLLATAARVLHQAEQAAGRLGPSFTGAFRAAQEEYAEAALFVSFVQHGTLPSPVALHVSDETYLGALSDFVGEIVRFAVKRATVGDAAAVGGLVAVATDIVAALAVMDLTGNLRSKFDQAKQHLRKLEDIQYDLHIHRHGS